MVRVSVLDYGVSNSGSILNMLKKIGVDASLIGTATEVLEAEKLILPGVGAFDNGMQALVNAGLDKVIREATLEKSVPLLGICLGMQLLCDGSAEGRMPGLGLIPGFCERIVPLNESSLKVPHMGWSFISNIASDPIFVGFEEDVRFYFVHAYHMKPTNQDAVIANVDYGQPLSAVVRSGLTYGVQFHPEKSHRFGMRLLKNFVDM